jgi:misacylated tRNA(Ala) deacylase
MEDFNSNPKDYNAAMHSVEHILNQTMVRMFNRGRSFSQHIEKKKSKCDYRFDRNLAPDEIAEVEKRVNDVVKQNLAVTEEYVTREEAGKIVNLAKLPEDAGEKIRIIRIGDYDVCPCSGVHVANTSEIGKFVIYSTDYNDTMLRVRFKLAQN